MNEDRKIAEFVTDLEIEKVISVTFFDRETGEEVLRFNYDTGGSDATSANTD